MNEETKEKKLTKKKSSTLSKKLPKKDEGSQKNKSAISSKQFSVSNIEDLRPDPILSSRFKDNVNAPIYREEKIRPCVQHKQSLQYYCEACEEPICDECQFSGPHNTELHRVTTAQEAFTSRYKYLSSGTYQILIEKRNQLLAQLSKIDARIAEIKSISEVIGREIKTEYFETLERLNSSEGTKYAILHHEMAEIQKDIKRIDSILDLLDTYLQGDLREDYLGFLMKFKDVHEHIEHVITKQFKVKIDVVPNDLPRDLTERRKIIENAGQAESLLRLKDEIIWNLMQEKKKLSQIAELDLKKAVQHEWKEWAKVIDNYCDQLLKYNLICSYCGVSLDGTTVNSSCVGKKGLGFTEEEPPIDWQGGHYFAKPQGEKTAFLRKLVANSGAMNIINVIKASSYEKVEELKSRLEELDVDKNYEVDQEEFRRVIRDLFLVQADKLVECLIGDRSNKVRYKELLQYLEVPSVSVHKPFIAEKGSLFKKEGNKESEAEKRKERYEGSSVSEIKDSEVYKIEDRKDSIIEDEKVVTEIEKDEAKVKVDNESDKEEVKEEEKEEIQEDKEGVKEEELKENQQEEQRDNKESEINVECKEQEKEQKEEEKKELMKEEEVNEPNKGESHEVKEDKSEVIDDQKTDIKVEDKRDVDDEVIISDKDETKSETKEDNTKRVINILNEKKATKEELVKRFEKYDTEHKGTVSLDSFYLVLMKMDFTVSNKEIESLAKLINPNLEEVNEIDYEQFINKII